MGPHRLTHRIDAASRHWLCWLLLYAALALAARQLDNPQHGFTLLSPQGGTLLAALLVVPFTGRGQRLRFLALAGLIDLGLRVELAASAPLATLWISASLVAQAWLGAHLLQRLAPEGRHPDTQRGVLGFALWGCLVPVALSSTVAALALFDAPGSFTAEWLWWFTKRLSGLLLLAPLLVLLFTSPAGAHRPPPLRSPGWEAALLWALCSVAAALLFTVSNPSGRALATYSFLLTPLLLIAAIRLPLPSSLFVVLSASVVAGVTDALDAGDTSGSAQRSLIALSVFLLINLMIVWLLGALIGERRRALGRAQKMRDMYEMLSNVNQTLINLKLTPTQLFERTCEIITQESDFTQACITTVPAAPAMRGLSGAGLLPGTICVPSGAGPLPADDGSERPCHLVQQVLANGNHEIRQGCHEEAAHEPSRGAMAAFPIRREGQAIQAVLTVFSRREDSFDKDMVRLFDELAGDIAFALNMLEDRQRLKLTSEVFEHSHESIIIADASGHILDVNPSFTRITGHERDQAIGQNPRILQSGRQDKAFYEQLWQSLLTEGHWTGEFWNRRRNGEPYPQRGTITAVRGENGAIEHFIAVMEDISERVRAEEKAQNLTNYDALTGLPNRVLLESRFRQAIAAAQGKPALVVLFIDLDEFKHVNDAMGHQQGDRLLRLVAERLRSELRDEDTLARFGGDEFVVLLAGERQEARLLAKRLIRRVRHPYQLGGQPVHIGCSIGIAQAPLDGTSLDELVQAADTAMYQAKDRGRGVYVFYASSMQHQAQTRLILRTELDNAIQRDELCAYYQPKVYIADGSVIGFEALVRWRHPERGMVSPGEFIPVAETSGQIAAIDRWMLKHVIAQLSRWRRQDHPVLPVAVNVSASLFSRPDFVAELAQWLAEASVPAGDLELEITEHVAMFDLEHTLSTLRALKELGVALSIDDFGTGYSGLAYLRDFPIDTIKIDMSFVKQVHTDEKNQGIVRAIIALADTMGLKTIAEGVESAEELAFLRQQGCWGYQGYYFSRPRESAEIVHAYLDAPA